MNDFYEFDFLLIAIEPVVGSYAEGGIRYDFD